MLQHGWAHSSQAGGLDQTLGPPLFSFERRGAVICGAVLIFLYTEAPDGQQRIGQPHEVSAQAVVVHTSAESQEPHGAAAGSSTG